ncbi:acetoacetate--CoA ligase [uncultured Nisaea sp.]|uniref:acetoacetate--CoA ligase n=1 Tax=uncultured Nisaea sp. TaxID=538215 RepID=UPI0030EF805E|tara:strand:- start:12654 stop:14654 length:2001 start_codon:yes stop_codon:yes gene_type:complete
MVRDADKQGTPRDMTTDSTPLWKPSAERIAGANITRFIDFVNRERGAGLTDYDSLYDWSVTELESFWDAVWDFTGIVGDKGSDVILKDGDKMPGAAFFPDAKINFAENLLRRRDNADAIVFWGEDKVKRRMSFAALYDEVSKFVQALKAEGVGPGDRVAAFMPNMPETIIATLATASLGAVWSSCSPDFGIRGVLDRFGQIEPTVFVAVEGYYYGGKSFDTLDKIAGILAELPTVKKTVIVPYTREEPPIGDIEGAVSYADFTGAYQAGDISFTRMGFNEPLYIMFSSGTTGVPKCIVHGIGGTLIQHLKEHQLHSDVKKDDRVFYFTTCGWMMWNWLISGLASEATLLLYDGNPFHPDGNILFDYADAEEMTLFGTSAKYIDALNKGGLQPKDTHDLSTVRAMTSTGSPLVPEGFDYVYRSIKADIQLSSISGGTDIVSCFVLGNPVGPVWRGEIQTRGLGLAVNVFDDDGKPVVGEKGELVCTRPFPCMPIMFWNDPDGAKYKGAYFESYDNIWCHGDYVELTPRGGMVIYGRSDAVLNPGGVRIGTAEIYRQVEKLPEVLEGLVIGQDWDDDVRVVLFIRLAEGVSLDDALTKKIKDTVRKGASPRHVPAKIIAVADIPRTKSGKIVELAVRNVVHGRPVKNVEALANPEALKLYENRPELAG